MKTPALALILLLAAGTYAQAQTIETRGGGGTLFDGEGGGIKLYLPDGSAGEFSGGIIRGQAVYGFDARFPLFGTEITAGDSQILFPLPTDYNASGYGFYTLGVTLRKKTKRQSLTIFGGAVNTQYVLPFFVGATPNTATGLIFYKLDLSDKWTFESHNVFDTRQTVIESLSYAPWRVLKMSASGGIGSNSPYGAVGLKLDTRRVLFRGGYSLENSDFRRIISPLYDVAENNRGNAHLELVPVDHFRLIGEHVNLLAPLLNGSSVEAVEDSVGGIETVGVFDVSANSFWSKSQGIHARGQTYSGGVRLFSNWLDVNQTVSATPSIGNVYSTAIQENLRPQFGIAEFVTHSDHSTSVNFGGHFTSNYFSASVGWSEQFLPFATGAPFQKVLSVQLTLRLPHDSSIQAQTLTDPAGHARFSVMGTNDLYGSAATAAGAPRGGSFGKWIVRGHVVDEQGQAVQGAAIQIGKQVAFTDGDGNFLVRLRGAREVAVQAIPSEFTAPGRWHVVSAPSNATPELEDAAIPLEIHVARN